MPLGVNASSVFVYTKTPVTPPFGRVLHQLGDLAPDARGLARGARNCTKCNPRRAHSLVQMGVHYRTNGGRPLSTFGGRIVVQMGDAAIDALSSPSYAPLSYKWGMIVVQMGDAHYQHLGDALSYRWGMLP